MSRKIILVLALAALGSFAWFSSASAQAQSSNSSFIQSILDQLVAALSGNSQLAAINATKATKAVEDSSNPGPRSGSQSLCGGTPMPPGAELQTPVCLNNAWQSTSALQINGLTQNDNVGIGTAPTQSKLTVRGVTNTDYLTADQKVSTPTLCLGPDCRQTWPAGGGGGVSGSGTPNFLAKWINANTVGNSVIQDDGTNVAVGSTPTSNSRLHVKGGQNLIGFSVTTANTNSLAVAMNADILNGTALGLRSNTGYGIYQITGTSTAARNYLQSRLGLNVINPDPASMLDVQGKVKIHDGTEGNGKVLTSDATGLASWQTPTGGGNFWADAGNGNINNTNTDRVGIGLVPVPDPKPKKLDVLSLVHTGIRGVGPNYGVLGESPDAGVGGFSSGVGGTGVLGNSFKGIGVHGSALSPNGVGVSGAGGRIAVEATSQGQPGSYGFFQTGMVDTKNYFQSPLGIGTTNPIVPLQVKNSSPSGYDTITMENNTGKKWSITSGGSGNVLADKFAISEVNVGSRLIVSPGGNVGIGTVNPVEKLDLGGGNIKMGYQVVSQFANNSAYMGVNCPPGKFATGGGCRLGGLNPNGASLVGTGPTANLNGWDCTFSAIAPQVTAYAICANIR